MEFAERYKALVVKNLPDNGIFIYVALGYDSWRKLHFHYTKQPLLLSVATTMADILEPYKQEASPEFIEKYYTWHTLMDVTLIMTDPANLSPNNSET